MARRKGHYGAGSIDKSGENSWRLRYRINRKRHTKVVEGTKTEAAKELRRLLHDGDEGRHVAPNKLTFHQWATDWLALKAQNLAGQTLERYQNLMRLHVVPVLGDKLLQRITAMDIDKLYAGLSLAPRTMGLVHIVVKSCFRTAVKKKLLAANPVEDAERPSAEDEEAGTVLEEEELAKLVKAFEGHSLYPIVATAAYTGARRSEILALRWQDIDLDRRTISITRSIERVKVDDRMVRRVKGPKKAKHARTIQIDAGLAALLRREKNKHLRLVAGVPDGAPVDLSLVKVPEEALAFPAVGEALTAFRPPNAVTTVFHDYAIGLGWDLRFHDLRATHETILLDKGVPVHVVAKRCGHDPAMLLKVYAKRTKKADAKAAGVIGTLTQGVLGQDWVEPFRYSQDVLGESLK
jgi:integrase